ncbi:MAG: molybdenum cofactor guanylyltransferase MobA [Giesbergeria sp.]|nr:molybdenum cofactor guanylyltransferase MobA [Giesbergeria sp.]
MHPTMDPQDITGLVLAGGQGSRMGGIDKGLEPFHGIPLALHALRRLQPQVGSMLVNDNRHLDTYRTFGAPVCPDAQTDFSGPLAGFLAGMEHCHTPWLLTVPCDTPLFPPDLAQRLAEAASIHGADMAMATALDRSNPLQPAARLQPVFCLLNIRLKDSLAHFIASGGRKVGAWAALHACVRVPFDRASDTPEAFSNANTLEELHQLEAMARQRRL